VDEDVMAAIRDRAGTHDAIMRALKARIKKVREKGIKSTSNIGRFELSVGLF
jgi:hypothetical protein